MPTLIFTLCKHKLDRIIIGPFHTLLYVYTKWAFTYLITFLLLLKNVKDTVTTYILMSGVHGCIQQLRTAHGTSM